MAVTHIEDLKPVYLIFSSEDLLLERALLRLRERVAAVADLDFNSDTFSGESADADAIIGAANTLPFGSDKRLVVVRDVERMPVAGQAALADYATDPSPTTCLVLTASKIARNTRLYKAVDALGGVAEYRAPGRNEYPRWVIGHFAEQGRRIDADGAAALVRAVGRDLRRLETEAEKIIAYVGARTKIGREDVERVVVTTAPVSVFDFINAVGARECASAIERLDDLLGSGEQLNTVHALTVRQLRTLVSIRALLDRGADRETMQRAVGLQDWQLRGALEQARRFSAEELSRALREAADVEVALKTGQAEPRVIFEMWIARVCSAR